MTSIRLVLHLFSLAASVRCALGEQNQLKDACEKAEAVIIARTSAPRTSVGVKRATLTMELDTVIKGDISPTATLGVIWPGSWQTIYSGVQPYRALWFLRHDGSGMWEAIPINGPNAPVQASGLPVQPRSETDPIAAAQTSCYQTVWGILNQNASHVDESIFHFVAVKTAFQASPATAIEAIPAIEPTIQTYAKSPSASLRGLALGYGLSQQKPEYLVQVAEQAAELVKTPAAPDVAGRIASWTNADPLAVSALGKLAQAKDGGAFSRSALDALMKIHSKDTVPVLIGFLDNADPRLQDSAVRGLSLFVRGAPVLTAEQRRAMGYLAGQPNPDFVDEGIAPYVTITPVPADEMPRYVAAWKDWWSRMSGKWSTAAQD